MPGVPLATLRSALCAILVLNWLPAFGQTTEFITFDQAKPVLDTYRNELPPELKSSSPQALGAKWPEWVRDRDRQVRERLDQGEEDTLTNLLRYGITFTKQPRIEWPILLRYGQDPMATAIAGKRAEDLVRGLASPGNNDHLHTMRAFLRKKGHSPDTEAGGTALKSYLLRNLGRMQKEYLGYLEERKKFESSPQDENQWLDLNSHLYAKRGISLDTDMRPNYAIDSALKTLAAKAIISRGSIRRVAIVGPGLDFVNKENGTDLYPPQTIQPFAVIDSLLRLRLADPNRLEVVTYDISSSVNQHLLHAKQRAAQGTPYTVQLPYDSAIRWVKGFQLYWENFGGQIGKPAAPIQVPDAAANLKLRAVQIQPAYVKRITPIDINVVFQHTDLPVSQQFDLVIGTNIFVYYGAFEQALTRENLARMIAPGGILLSNNLLSGISSSRLKEAARVMVLYSEPNNAELVFVYRRWNR